MIASRVFCYNSDTKYEEYSPIDRLVFRRFGKVVNISCNGVTAANLNSITIQDRFINPETISAVAYMRYNNKAYIGLIGIRSDWAKIYVTYIPSYPADNNEAPGDAVLYFNITYMK